MFPEIYKVKTDVGTYIPEERLTGLLERLAKRIDKILAAEREGLTTFSVDREEFLITLNLARQINISLPVGTTDKEMVKINKIIKEEVMVAQIGLPPEPKVSDLLLHGDVDPIVDSSSHLVEITNHDVFIHTDTKKFGTGSMCFDNQSGNRDVQCYLTTPADENFNFGTGDFTIECWHCSDGSGDDYQRLLSGGSQVEGDSTFFLGRAGAGNFNFGYGENGGVDAEWNFEVPFIVNTWMHYMVCREAGTLYFFCNGVLLGTAMSQANISGGSGLFIGCRKWVEELPIEGFYGCIDEVRIIKGIAMHTESFTPDSVAYTG